MALGLARFAHTPLLPAIIDGHWFDPSTAAYLGVSNLAGYFAGALLGRPIAGRLSPHVTLRLMMLLATATFFVWAWPVNFLWFFVWRFAAGVGGGCLMVLAAHSVLPHVPASRRGLAAGVIFRGVGVAASGMIVPLLLRESLQQTWIGLGAICLLLTMIAWNGWPAKTPANQPTARHPHAPKQGKLRALYAEHGLNAAGWAPHMIFLVDFVARGLRQGIAAGSEYWIIFGIGATFGPVLAGLLADRAGFGASLRLAFFIEAIAVRMPALGLGTPWLTASSVIVGAFVTGTVPLVFGRIGELLLHHPAQQKAAWSMATVCFALCQATAAYSFSFLFGRTGGDYRMLLLIGTVAMIAALAVDLIAAVFSRAAPHRLQG